MDDGVDDTYTSRDHGTNGSAGGGTGLLLDAGGEDAYIAAGVDPTNGGGFAGSGLLLDDGGVDTYQDSAVTCANPPTMRHNCVVLDKGLTGAKVDGTCGVVFSPLLCGLLGLD